MCVNMIEATCQGWLNFDILHRKFMRDDAADMSYRRVERSLDDGETYRIALVGDVELNLIAPYFSEAGFEVYVPSGFGAWRQEVLDEKSALHKFHPDLIFDVTKHDEILSQEVPGFFDERMKSLASMPYSIAGIEALVEEARFALLSAPKKILAVDADDTLWRGVLAEDGVEAIEPFEEFQNGLKALGISGIPLVLLTKNDAEAFAIDASPFAAKGMALGLDDFASVKASWQPKSKTLAEAVREMNLGLDSVLFVDDNPLERAQMKAELPEVTVAPFPKALSSNSARQFIRRMKEYFFSVNAGGIEEDALRVKDYKSSKARLGISAATKEEYLRGLELRVVSRNATSADIPRLAQMAAKTNQFNTTTIRRSEGDFCELLADETKRIFVYRCSDRFVDQGIVAYVVADIANRRLTDFVMSCRAMGRTLEFYIWRHIKSELGFEPAIDFIPTEKNAPARAFVFGEKGEATFYDD